MHVSIGVQREDETQPFDSPGDRDFALGCMARGIAALCIEQRSFGERREQTQKQVSPHGCHDAAMQALLVGKTLIGERVYDVERGIDYLATRGDVDMHRVGVMGNSGGGTITIYAAALLPRLAFAMPSCSFCTFRDSIGAIYHCADNYVPGILKAADMADVLGLFAPRPVVVVAGRDDSIFPIDGVRSAFEQLRHIYVAAGAEEACQLVVGEGGHRFYAADAWPVMQNIIQGEAH
jgi:dienelactone hydrolase